RAHLYGRGSPRSRFARRAGGGKEQHMLKLVRRVVLLLAMMAGFMIAGAGTGHAGRDSDSRGADKADKADKPTHEPGIDRVGPDRPSRDGDKSSSDRPDMASPKDIARAAGISEAEAARRARDEMRAANADLSERERRFLELHRGQAPGDRRDQPGIRVAQL